MNISDIEPIKKGSALDPAKSVADAMREYDAKVTAIIAYIMQMAEQHFAEAGLELRINEEPTSYWFLFGVSLDCALIPHTRVLNDPGYLALLRALFEKIFDFLMYAYCGDPAAELSELYRAFGSGLDCGPILPLLLPASAQTVMVEVDRILDAYYEDSRLRADQMGY